MTKRTAMLMAAGVVLALFGGSVALSFALSGGGTAEAGTDPKAAREKPIVRTIHRTIRVEKQAKGSNRPVEVVTLAAPAPASLDASSSHDGYDDHGYDDDDHGYDDDDHGYDDDDHGYDDGEGDDD